jgi:hypothetical protein
LLPQGDFDGACENAVGEGALPWRRVLRNDGVVRAECGGLCRDLEDSLDVDVRLLIVSSQMKSKV